jgi:serine/threonine-protein kinase
MPTQVATPSPPPAHSTPSGSSASGAGHAYQAGDVLGGRYRVVARVGRGGMGEVYRADDLKLGQPVSLKFLPPELESDPARLALFHAEVRNARQVSHPNVCRVYDIGDLDGRHFLTMEFVDGEDLAALLRRIGRLPKAKADEVARQLCAGLAAAHDRGVLHRDLKPSNVMIDGEGRVRITDFGLAVRAGEGSGEVAGTPAYMAPEQFEGKPVTAQSDLYSLGLILYEIYTGQRAFEAESFVDWRSKHSTVAPTSPSVIEREVDDAVERVILRCLEKDPSRRPSSALKLAAALPGGDPLAAALAAGETPSPEMVAAAGGEGALAPRVAWSLLGGVVLAFAALLWITPYSNDLGLAPLRQSRELLTARAREIVGRLGYSRNPVDSETWYQRNYDPMRYLAQRLSSPESRRRIAAWGPPVFLAYRQDPRPMVPRNRAHRVSPNDPPFELSESVLLTVDGAGRLHDFAAIPPQRDSVASGAAAAPVDWGALFELAGLDRAAFTDVRPEWVPPFAFDAQAEWIGAAPWARDIPLRVSAAAWRGRPVYFEVLGPWSRAWRMTAAPRSRTQVISDLSFNLLFFVVMIAGLALAVRNLRLGRGDRRGALRLGLFAFVCGMLAILTGAHLGISQAQDGLDLVLDAMGQGLTTGAFLALVLLAIEPFVRRRMPELMIGWARVLDGRLRDPRVGRDLLLGALCGTLGAVVIHVTNALPTWIDFPGQTTIPSDFSMLAGGRDLLAFLFDTAFGSLGPALFLFGLYFLLRLVVRKVWLAVLLLGVIATLAGLGGENALLETPSAVVIASLIVLVLTRFGLLAAVAFWLFQSMLSRLPLPLAPDAPYLVSSLLVAAVLLGLVAYAFRIALGPRPVFSLALDE